MKVFITGGAGFIGSNFIRHIHNKYPSMELLNYDKLTYAGNLTNFSNMPDTFHNKYTFVKGDICDEKLLSSAISDFKPDIVIAFAAESHVDRSIENPQQFLVTNVLGTETVLRVCRDKKVPKLIHISTDEVYGSVPEGTSSEDHAFRPNSPYSASKAAGDLLCRSYIETFKTPIIVIRASNAYGGFQHPEKFIPRSITNLLRGQPINLYSDGRHVREWLFVEDFCHGIERLMFRGYLGEAYNLGSGVRASNIQICEALLNILGMSAENIKFVADRLGHDMRYALNSDKLSNQINRMSTVDLEKGLKLTVEWYQANKEWWLPLVI